MLDKTDENGNIVNHGDENIDDLADQVRKWLDHCHKTLDFVYDQEMRKLCKMSILNLEPSFQPTITKILTQRTKIKQCCY